MKTAIKPNSPIRKPVQARSIHTNEAIFEATIQVLLRLGAHALTTTKVADRAGVSVGTLYQYFPNKQVLLNAVLERHLLDITQAVEQACLAMNGKPVKAMMTVVVGAFVHSKFKRVDISRALYSIAAQSNGAQIVAKMTERSQLAICNLLASEPRLAFHELKLISFILGTSMIGPIQALLSQDASPEAIEKTQSQLIMLSVAYLKSVAKKKRSSRS